MKNRTKKRSREEALPSPYEKEFESALAFKRLAHEDIKDRQSNEPIPESANFTSAHEIFTDLISKLNNAAHNEMTDENTPHIYRYIEVITTFSDMLLEFEKFDEAEIYILEYVRLSDIFKLGVGNKDSLGNDYYNLGLISQARFAKSQDIRDLYESSSRLIHALAAYRLIRSPHDCHEVAEEFIKNCMLRAKVNNTEIDFANDAIKDLMTDLIETELSIENITAINQSDAVMYQFFSHQQWEIPYVEIEGIALTNKEIRRIKKLQRAFTPEADDSQNSPIVVNVKTSLRLFQPKTSPHKMPKLEGLTDKYPITFSLWDKPPEQNNILALEDEMQLMSGTNSWMPWHSENEDDMPSFGL